MKNKFLLFVSLASLPLFSFAQTCSNFNFQMQADINSVCGKMVATMKQDSRPGMNYLYVANKEAGLMIYDISNLTSPQFVDSIPTSMLSGLEVMNLSQSGNYLYLATGNHFINPQHSGMAILDVTNPLNAFVTDTWVDSLMPVSGGGIIETEGNYAFLGAMLNGMIILDISDKFNITFASRFVPDITFPNATNIDTVKYNVRGLVVKNDIVYMCYDRGGFRIVNVSNKSNPVETGKFCNPALTNNAIPRAYNNLILDDTLVYIAVDYCGLEILNVSDTSNIQLVSWLNPWGCPSSNPLGLWLSSNGHANEIAYDANCKTLFIATGRSDMYAIDVSNPLLPDSCNYYGWINNNVGTWGVSNSGNRIFLSYICTWGIPFPSLQTYVRILTYTPCPVATYFPGSYDFDISPNPVDGFLQVTFAEDMKDYFLRIVDARGKIVFEKMFYENNSTIKTEMLSNGIYTVQLIGNSGMLNKKFIVLHEASSLR